MLRGGVRVQSGRVTVRVCMGPPRCDECSGAPHWQVGYDSLTGQGASEPGAPCEMSKRLPCLRGRLISCVRNVAVHLAATKSHRQSRGLVNI